MLKYIALATTWLAPFGTFLVNYRLPLSISAGIVISKILPNALYYYHDKKLAASGERLVDNDVTRSLLARLQRERKALDDADEVLQKLHDVINNQLRTYLLYTEDKKLTGKWDARNLKPLQDFLDHHIPDSQSIGLVLPSINDVVDIYLSHQDFLDFSDNIKRNILVQNIGNQQSRSMSNALKFLDIAQDCIKQTFNESHLAERYYLLDKSLRSVAHLSIVLFASAVIPVSGTAKTIICGFAVLDAYKWAPKTTSVDTQEMLREIGV